MKGRLEEMDTVKGKEDIRTLLGDMKDEEYPLYRVGPQPDHLVTVATSIFDTEKKTLEIYVNNPSHCDPVSILHMP